MIKINLWKSMAVGGVLALVILSAPVASAVNGLITSSLAVGSRGEDVSTLQSLLAGSPSLYSAGLITGYFGNLTKAAVNQFQLAYGIFGESGRVGPSTMAKLNTLIASGLGADVAAPYIYNVTNQSTTNNSSTFSWNTNELSWSKIYYDSRPLLAYEVTQNFTEPIITGSVLVDNNVGLSHTMTINNLLSNTTYYYMIESIDKSGNPSVTLQGSFRTNQ